MKQKIINTAVIVIAGLFSGLLAYTSASKLLNKDRFISSLQSVDFLNQHSSLLYFLIPSLELALGLLLVYTGTRLIGLFGFLLYLLTVTGYLLTMLLLQKNLPCVCVGINASMTWWQQLGANILLIALVALAILLIPRNQYHIAIHARLFRPK